MVGKRRPATRTENAIEVAKAVTPSEMVDRADEEEMLTEGDVFFAWRTRSTSELRAAQARTSDRDVTKTAATVRHEREQGDERRERERSADRREREKETELSRRIPCSSIRGARAARVAHGSSGRMPDRRERESSTWFARAGGGRDETRDRVGASEKIDRRRQSEGEYFGGNGATCSLDKDVRIIVKENRVDTSSDG